MSATTWSRAEVALTAAGQPISPWFGALVDSIDPSAVVNLLAIVPKPDGSGLRAFERKNGGWVEAPNFLRALTGIKPPPVVELDQETLMTVIEQMDAYDRKKAESK
jgi:hypothetical protein